MSIFTGYARAQKLLEILLPQLVIDNRTSQAIYVGFAINSEGKIVLVLTPNETMRQSVLIAQASALSSIDSLLQ